MKFLNLVLMVSAMFSATVFAAPKAKVPKEFVLVIPKDMGPKELVDFLAQKHVVSATLEDGNCHEFSAAEKTAVMKLAKETVEIGKGSFTAPVVWHNIHTVVVMNHTTNPRQLDANKWNPWLCLTKNPDLDPSIGDRAEVAQRIEQGGFPTLFRKGEGVLVIKQK